jgi:uncharacterized protein YtpQ (UPF0354 family)
MKIIGRRGLVAVNGGVALQHVAAALGGWRAGLGIAFIAFSIAAAAPTQPDPMGFTNFMAGKIRESVPQAGVQVAGPLQITVTLSKDNIHDLRLDNVYSACVRDHETCAEEMRTFVQHMAAFYATPEPALDAKSLRVAVRQTDYVQALRNHYAKQGGLAAVRITGDYWMIVVSDLPTTIRMVSQKDLRGLGLTADQAFAEAKKRMVSNLRRVIKRATASDRSSVVLISDNSYTSTLFAFPELWASTAEAFGGNLLVAVPASDVVLVGDGASPTMIAQMAETARQVVRRDEHPFSATVFRWTPQGWVAVTGAR